MNAATCPMQSPTSEDKAGPARHLARKAERDAWVANIHNGVSREMVLVGFAESNENIAKVAHVSWLIQV
jgi:hypothetical protein